MSDVEPLIRHIHVKRDTSPNEFAAQVAEVVLIPMLTTFCERQPHPGNAAWDVLCSLLGSITGCMSEVAGPAKTAELLLFAAKSTAQLKPDGTADPCTSPPKTH